MYVVQQRRYPNGEECFGDYLQDDGYSHPQLAYAAASSNREAIERQFSRFLVDGKCWQVVEVNDENWHEARNKRFGFGRGR